MCRDRGYTPVKNEHVLRWKVDENDFHSTSYNLIAGRTGLPVIMYDGVQQQNTSVDALWGIIPFWSKDLKEGMISANKSVNARVETLEESRLYKPLFERGQRCLIPCTHYFEHHWLDGGKKKIPFAIKKADDEIFSTPGLYSTWVDKQSGELILSYSMLTTGATELMKKVHNGGEHPGRMPLVIERDMEAIWLNPNATEKELRNVMGYQIPANGLKAWPVHTIRGKNARTGPDVLEEWREYSDLLKRAA
jgi:putative SOS response-associated peptidase YedK